MNLQQLDLTDVERRMDAIKRHACSPVLTNYFRQTRPSDQIYGILADSTVIFVKHDSGFSRLYFSTSDLPGFAQLLEGLALTTPVVIDYVTREPDFALQQIFLTARFKSYAEYVRLVTSTLPSYVKDHRLHYASATDLSSLRELLPLHFDRYTDHFPDEHTLLHLINNRQILLNTQAGAIDGYIIFRVTGKTVNFNYFYNKSADPRDALRLLHNFYAVLHERGITRGVQWNNVTNFRVRRLHRQFGWKEDGTRDFIYLKTF